MFSGFLYFGMVFPFFFFLSGVFLPFSVSVSDIKIISGEPGCWSSLTFFETFTGDCSLALDVGDLPFLSPDGALLRLLIFSRRSAEELVDGIGVFDLLLFLGRGVLLLDLDLDGKRVRISGVVPCWPCSLLLS